MQIDSVQPTNTITKERISFEEYLRRYDSYEGGRTEWIAGFVEITPVTNNPKHNELLRFLSTLCDIFMGSTGRGLVVLAGVPMYYSDERPAREPDLMILLTEHEARLTARCVEGVADIVIEIVSPESDARDRGDKFLEYEAAGVPEYWLFDPLRQDAVFYSRAAAGYFQRVPRDAQGRLISPLLPGFALDPAPLWGSKLPNGAEIVALVQAMIAEG